jgi:hypothetical protein
MSIKTLDDRTSATLNKDSRAERYAPAGEKTDVDVQNTMFLKGSMMDQEVEREVIVMKKWGDGTVYFIDPDHLDTIDAKRIQRALARADRAGVELWTILKETTLSNGANGLDFFHQLCQTFKPQGANKAPRAERLMQILSKDRSLFIDRGVRRAGPRMMRGRGL